MAIHTLGDATKSLNLFCDEQMVATGHRTSSKKDEFKWMCHSKMVIEWIWAYLTYVILLPRTTLPALRNPMRYAMQTADSAIPLWQHEQHTQCPLHRGDYAADISRMNGGLVWLPHCVRTIKFFTHTARNATLRSIFSVFFFMWAGVSYFFFPISLGHQMALMNVEGGNNTRKKK